MSLQQQVVDIIKTSQKILVMPSSPPDGDSIGSALALYLILKKLNKEITVVCPETVPDVYHFLPATHIIGDRVVASKDFIITLDTHKIKIENVKTINENDKVNIIITPANGRLSESDVSFNYGSERYDLIITVDTGGLEQLGHLYTDHVDMFHQIPVVNIDHHFSNEHFGKLNYVDIMAPATTELLIPVFEMLEKDTGQKLIDEDVATLLLAGIITDTGSFQNANTSPRAFDSSAKLVSYGARQQEIIQHIFKTKQLSTLKLWGRILTKIQTDEKYNIVWSVLTRKDFQDTGSDENETGGIIDELLSNAPGAEIVLLLKERRDGTITGSIRTTTPSVDASALAERFGGGGHVQAAGFRMAGDNAEKLEQQVLKTFREFQAERLGRPLEEEQIVMNPPITSVSKPIAAAPVFKTPPVVAATEPKATVIETKPVASEPVMPTVPKPPTIEAKPAEKPIAPPPVPTPKPTVVETPIEPKVATVPLTVTAPPKMETQIRKPKVEEQPAVTPVTTTPPTPKPEPGFTFNATPDAPSSEQPATEEGPAVNPYKFEK